MNDSRTWGIITLIIVLISGFLLFSTFKSKEGETRLRILKEQELSAKLTELAQTQEDLEQLKKQKTDAEKKFQDQLAAMDASIDTYKKSAQSMADRIDALTKEKEALVKNTDINTVLVGKLNKKIERLEAEKADLEATVKKLRSEGAESKAALESVPEEEKGDVQAKPAVNDVDDLGKIVIHRSSNQAAIVEHVNTLYGFVVLSAGQADGLHKNSIVNISRNNRFIAKAIVQEARENVSSAVTLPEWTREEIKIGDLISVNNISPAKSSTKL
jgi:peptidoglycan hydrolase CwlO-like protein